MAAAAIAAVAMLLVIAPLANAAAATASGTAEVFVYPNKGQTAEQQDRDRYECYRWAVDQAAYDPAAGDADPGSASDYKRANSACLEGRGYTVR